VTSITNMVMPKIEREAEARNYGKFVISPLERGYGVTLGNALRRVLLSSLEGSAVTSIRIADVLHEFSEIPGVREDVIQVTLQVKQLRLKLDGVDSTRMHLEVRGEGTVTAADIITPAEVEIVNPELLILSSLWSVVEAIRRPMSEAGTCLSANCLLTQFIALSSA
jgi:DNA-directed RNA polymerase subunit alpha